MKNAIVYYYNLNPKEIHQVNKKYKFEVSGNEYILEPFINDLRNLEDIYELQLYLVGLGFFNSRIVLNVNRQILTVINGVNYVLLRLCVLNKMVQISDILLFNNLNVANNRFLKIRRDDWYKLWIDKIDYVEYQISQFGKKYLLIRESSDYYVGLVENCISLLSTIEKGYSPLVISHNRTFLTSNLVDFYNPMNFIIDNRVRDFAEYVKDCVQRQMPIMDIVQKYIYYNNLNSYEISLLFIRIMYPSYYFDMCEIILEGKIAEDGILGILDNVQIVEECIRNLYLELKSIANLPDIEWLIKK